MPKQEPREQVQQIPMSEIHPFRNHPFKVLDDELMQQTIDSIMQVGILNPAIIRPDPEGGYEMVAGHRRLYAADLAGLKTIPAIVRNLTDDEAVILMVDSNLQRETISPMERAQAYKMKLEALKHQGKKVELQADSTSPQLGEKSSWAVSIVANDANASRSQVQRFIRLTELLPEVQEKVESKEIAFSPAVELSYLTHDEQRQFLDAMDYSQNTPSLSQAQRLKKQMAKTFVYLEEQGFADFAALSNAAAAAEERFSELKATIKAEETRISEIQTLRTHIINYSKTREVYAGYRKAGYSKKYLAEHESDIILHKAAKKVFDVFGLKKLPTVKSLNEEFARLLTEKKAAYADYHKTQEQMRELLIHKANAAYLLGLEERKQQIAERQQEENSDGTSRSHR